MSRHKSFGKAFSGKKKRNVLTRFERVEKLRSLGLWKEDGKKKVTGLPKTPS
jgi:small basic protein (TIGR04137 family)